MYQKTISKGAIHGMSTGLSLSDLNTSGNLLDAPGLHGRLFKCEIFDGESWLFLGDLALFPNTAFLNQTKLYNVHYDKMTNSIVYGWGKGDGYHSGRFHFASSQLAFVGTIIQGSSGVQKVRGTGYQSIYSTERRKEKTQDAFEKWKEFKFVNKWEDTILRTHYYLGSDDITSRTAVVDTDDQGRTFIGMHKSYGPFGKNDSFQIAIAFGAKSFEGTYTDEKGQLYEWKGSLEWSGKVKPDVDMEYYQQIDQPAGMYNVHPSMLSTQDHMQDFDETAPTLGIQELDSVSSFQKKNGEIVDMAQVTAGKYLNYCMVNAVDEPWLGEILGHKFSLPDSVGAIANKHQQFFHDHSVLALGQALYDTESKDPKYHDMMQKVNTDAMKEKWKELSKNKEFSELSPLLYLEGYRNAIPGIQPYLEDGKAWAKKYYEYLTDPATLSNIQGQLGNRMFKHLKQFMYEWYAKLTVLDPDEHSFTPDGKVDEQGNSDKSTKATYGQQMLCIAYSALLGVAYQNARWHADIGPILTKIIRQAHEGDVSQLRQTIDKQKTKEMQEILRQMISTFNSVDDFANKVNDLLTIWNNKHPEKYLTDATDDLFDGLTRLFDESSPQRKTWEAFKENGPKALRVLLYGASAGYLLYSLIKKEKGSITVQDVVEDVQFGLLSLALVGKGADQLMTIGIGEWLRIQSIKRPGFLGSAAGDIAKWFGKSGVTAETELGRAFLKVFGKNFSDFFATRLGPAIAVVGVVMSTFWLIEAIHSGDVREIVFDSLGLFFSIADVVFVGLEMMSFAWAGPIGLAIAGIGIIVVLVQFIWNLISPPKPPKDPIEKFVEGPMTQAGFVS